jgi:leader peptidase (prepilin peptidase)/N-methyltransferase
MLILGIVFTGLFGLLLASFLNVCIDRLPAGQSLVSPPSHCSACGRRLRPTDLVPVFSYLWLRGKCRYCGAVLPRRLLWVEMGTAILFGYLYWHYGLSVELALALFYTAIFIVLSVIDLDHQLILNRIVYPAAVIVLVVSLFVAPSRMLGAGGRALTLPMSLPQAGIVQAVIGAAIGLVVFTLIIILSRGGMGWGDAKLAGLIGAMTGYLVPLAIFVAVVVGGLLAVVLLVFKLRKRKEGIPFGPFLAIGAMVTLLWGNGLAGWYLGGF